MELKIWVAAIVGIILIIAGIALIFISHEVAAPSQEQQPSIEKRYEKATGIEEKNVSKSTVGAAVGALPKKAFAQQP